MSRRKVDVVILCEDRQQSAFARRFLIRRGFHRRRIEVDFCEGGSGEAYVRERYPVELAAMRGRHAQTRLVVMTDADVRTIAEKKGRLDQACQAVGQQPRQNTEAVGLFIPRRNIETWLNYLRGNEVDEEQAYPKHDRERDCGPEVARLDELCGQQNLPADAPPSLQDACAEWPRIA